MKRLFILTTFLLSISPICLNAQELTLEKCQQQARAHYPLIKRYGLIEKTKEYNISNIDKGYLPQVSLSAKASYQSDDLYYASGIQTSHSGSISPFPVINIDTQGRFNPYLDYKVFMVPALMAQLLMMLCGFLPALNIVSEKEFGTIEQINVVTKRIHNK